MDSTLLRLLIKPRHWLPGAALSTLYLINLLPYPVKIRIGFGIGKLAHLLVRRRKHIASVNLKLCFPELTDAERLDLLKRSFDNFGAGLVEMAMGWWTEPGDVHAMTEVEGLQHLNEASARGKGVLLVGAHYSSLDLAAKFMTNHYIAHAVHRLQSNELINYFLELRRATSVKSLISYRSGRKIISSLRSGDIVWFAPDHDMGEKLSVYAPFFGRPAATLTAPGRLVKMTGATALLYSHHRRADNKGYKVQFRLVPDDFATMDDVGCATVLNRMLAEQIRIDPAQYYWFHRRFKSQADLPRASLYEAVSTEN